MKRLLLLAAVLGLAASAGTAEAVPLTTSALGIWSADMPGATAASADQQALPGTRHLIPLIPGTGSHDPASGLIAFNTAANTVGGFLAAGAVTDTTCGAACQGTALSAAGFAHASLFEFLFTVTSAGTLSVMHDGGISLFADGGGANNPTGSDLFSTADSAPGSLDANTAHLAAGTYDLFFEATNGLPAVLETDFRAAVPEPPSLALFASGLLALGWLVTRGRQRG